MIKPDSGLTEYYARIKKTDVKKLEKREIEDKETLLLESK